MLVARSVLSESMMKSLKTGYYHIRGAHTSRVKWGNREQQPDRQLGIISECPVLLQKGYSYFISCNYFKPTHISMKQNCWVQLDYRSVHSSVWARIYWKIIDTEHFLSEYFYSETHFTLTSFKIENLILVSVECFTDWRCQIISTRTKTLWSDCT